MLSYFKKTEQIWTWLPKLQAHRGYWASGFSQNSLASIQAAFDIGFEMAEFDIRLTLDQKIILFHDDCLQNKPIEQMSFEEINRITSVNTLNEVFQWLQDLNSLKFKLNIEIKSHRVLDSRLEKQLCDLISQYRLDASVLVSSFNPFSLYKLRLQNSKIYRALLYTTENHPKNKWYLTRMIFNYLAAPHLLHVDFKCWPQVQKIKKHWNIPVVLWTVNDLQIARSYLNQNHPREVMSIITDTVTPYALAPQTN